jgi:hypothetical protein
MHFTKIYGGVSGVSSFILNLGKLSGKIHPFTTTNWRGKLPVPIQ